MILRKQFLAHVAQTSPSPMLVEVARAENLRVRPICSYARAYIRRHPEYDDPAR